MARLKETRARLTWDEIHEIERSWKGDKDGPAYKDVTALVRHIKFIEHLLDEATKPRSKSEMRRTNAMRGLPLNEGVD